MDFEVKVPDISTTGDSVVLTNWLIEVGQQVKRGQAIVEVETDKATTEVESAASGTLKELKAQPGDNVAVGQVIAIIEKKGAASAAPAQSTKTPAAEPLPVEKPAATDQPTPQPAKPAGGMFAKNRQAREETKQPTEDAGLQAVPLSPTQRVVGQRMLQSKQTAPHFYLQTSANAEPMAKKRKAAPEKKIAWDAFFVKAVAQALKKFNKMCYRIENDKFIPHGAGAVGVAVSIDENLFVVPIEQPTSKTVEQISDEIRDKVAKIQQGDSAAKKIRPAAITVTNLGVANVEVFTPIINPPESSILSIGKTKPQAVVENGQIIIQNRVSIVLSVDHRIINGKYAADFLTCIVEELEKD